MFGKGYNLRRHENEYCPSREYVDTGQPDVECDEEMSNSSCDESNHESSEGDGEIEEEIDPWATLIDDAKEMVRPEYNELLKTLQMEGQEEGVAKHEAFEEILPALQKEFTDVYVDNLQWMKALKMILMCIKRSWKQRRHL